MYKLFAFHFFVLCLFLCSSCAKKITPSFAGIDPANQSSKPTTDATPFDQDQSIFSWQVDKIDNKPISLFLDDNRLLPQAAAYYKGEFAISDHAETYAIIEQAYLAPPSLRPFYFHLVRQIIHTADGGVAQGVAPYIANYIQWEGCTFAQYLQNDENEGRAKLFEDTKTYLKFYIMRNNKKEKNMLRFRKKVTKENNHCAPSGWDIIERLLNEIDN